MLKQELRSDEDGLEVIYKYALKARDYMVEYFIGLLRVDHDGPITDDNTGEIYGLANVETHK